MYTVLDLKKGALEEMVQQIGKKIEECYAYNRPVVREQIIHELSKGFYFDLELEYELWLVENIGVDVAVSMCLFYNQLPDFSTGHFCRDLARQTYRIMLSKVIENAFNTHVFRAGERNFVRWKVRLDEWFSRVYDEPDDVSYS